MWRNITAVEYALLYTFSTIPQTLAAALGVLAAFVLYRLQSDSNTLWQDAHELALIRQKLGCTG